ncbi:MAG TPA: MFS transporter [Ktedonobacterales bacterium]
MKTEPTPDEAFDAGIAEQGAELGAVAAPPSPSAGQATRHAGSWHVLRNRDYALLFWGQLISSGGTQIRAVALLWQIFVISHSNVAVGTLGLVQAIPRLVLSIVGGVFADALDRRKMLMIINVSLAATSAALAITTILGIINIPLIYAIALISSAVSAFEFPTRQAIVPTLVRREEIADALSLNMVGMQVTTIIATAVGGFVIAWVGLANTYWIDFISYFVVVAALLLMVVPLVPAEKRAQVGLEAFAEGWRFLRAHPIILAALSLDFCATFFGSPRALLPYYASNVYHTGAQGLGILLAATSIGAVVLAPLTGRIGRLPRQGLGVVLAVLGWGVAIVLFGVTPGALWLGVFFLAAAGAADMVSMILRGIIVQLTSPDELRGRMSAVNAMFVIGGPMLGQFESGVVAAVLTPELSVVTGGAACIVATLAIAAKVPELLKARLR